MRLTGALCPIPTLRLAGALCLATALWSSPAGGEILPPGTVSQASRAIRVTQAQEPLQAAVRGRVVDDAREVGLSGVVVSLAAPLRFRITDAEGRFLFDGVEPGVYSLEVEQLGFGAVTETVRVERPDTTVEVEIRLVPEAIRLEPLVVEAWRSPILREVYDRMEWMGRAGLGDGFDRASVEASGAIRVTHLLARLPGVRLRPIPGRVGGTVIRLSSRVNCDPSVYINGIRTPLAGASLDDFVSIGEVESVEVFRRLSALPGEFADERARQCGAVVIYTRRAADGPGTFSWKRMVSFAVFLALTYFLPVHL